VYPEVINGNPYNAARVVRWMLYYPGLNGGQNADGVIAFGDPIACYSMSFCVDLIPHLPWFNLSAADMQLHAIDRAHNISMLTNRSGVLFLDRKTKFYSKKRGNIYGLDTSPPNVPGATYVNREPNKADRLALFRKHERCYIFDPMTYCAVEAALMGCLTIVNPVPGVDRDEWQEAFGTGFAHGIAYGDSESELQFALATRHKLRERLETTQAEHDKSVVDWIQAMYSMQDFLWPWTV